MDKVACQFLHFFTCVSLCHQGQTKSGRTAYLCYFYVTGIQSLEKKITSACTTSASLISPHKPFTDNRHTRFINRHDTEEQIPPNY